MRATGDEPAGHDLLGRSVGTAIGVGAALDPDLRAEHAQHERADVDAQVGRRQLLLRARVDARGAIFEHEPRERAARRQILGVDAVHVERRLGTQRERADRGEMQNGVTVRAGADTLAGADGLGDPQAGHRLPRFARRAAVQADHIEAQVACRSGGRCQQRDPGGCARIHSGDVHELGSPRSSAARLPPRASVCRKAATVSRKFWFFAACFNTMTPRLRQPSVTMPASTEPPKTDPVPGTDGAGAA